MPARVWSITAVTLLQPPATAPQMASLLTPLQLHTWVSSGRSATPTSAAGAAEVEEQLGTALGQGQAAVEGLLEEGHLAAVADQRRADDAGRRG